MIDYYYFLEIVKVRKMNKAGKEISLNFDSNFLSPHANNKEMAMISQQPTPTINVSDAAFNGQPNEEEGTQTLRTTGSLLCFWLVVLCTAAIPVINLLLFFLQPYQLANVTKASLQVEGLGREDDFTYFYLVMGLYVGVTAVFVTYSCFFTSFCERVKLYLLVDNILICMLATDVAYTALHIVCFTAVYSTDDQSNLEAEYVVLWQDVLVIILYCVTNLAFVGIFRIMMTNIYWKSWQTVIYKLAIVVSSLAYLIMGLIYIFGYDTLSEQVNDFNKDLEDVFNYLYASNNAAQRGTIPYFQRMSGSLDESKSKIASFVIFYVFTNFAFSFEVIAKLSDFDGTAELATHYRLQELENQEINPQSH